LAGAFSGIAAAFRKTWREACESLCPLAGAPKRPVARHLIAISSMFATVAMVTS
jgi:hypothetical protein